RVQPIASLESLDGDDLLPLERADAQDAGIHRLVTYFAGQSEVGKHHGAGAAVAFGAAFLGADEAPRLAQPGEQRARRGFFGERDALAVQQEIEARLHRWIARHTRSGVSGMSRCSTPNSASASSTAFDTAASAGVVPPSPPPRMPSGWLAEGTSLISVSNIGSWSAGGMA